MRIAGFIRLWHSHRGVGGMQGHALNLYSGLAARGHEVEVFTTGHSGKGTEETDRGVLVHYLKGAPDAVYSKEYFALSKEKFLAIHATKPFNIIHSESRAAEALLRGPVPVVATWHGISYCGFRDKFNAEIFNGTASRFQDHIEKGIKDLTNEIRMFQLYNHHVAISHQAQDDICSIYGIPKERVSLVVNGFDVDQFKIDRPAGLGIRSKYKIPPNAFVIGAGGRLTPEKGHSLLASIASNLTRSSPNVFLLVVGTGGEERRYRGLNSPQVICTGAIPYQQMSSYYNAMNVFANPTTRYGGLDMVMQEAMLCGVPVIASDVGSIKKTLLTSSDYGEVFPLGDKGTFLSMLLAQRDKNLIAEKINKHITSFATLNHMCTGMGKVFEKVLKEKSV
jgi:glycosyltransferase involved in cell wall biosynthesis